MSTPLRLRLVLHISADEMIGYYQGAREVQATCVDGRVVRFPARILQPFIAHDGVHGEFVLEYDAAHKFRAIRRVG